MNIPSLPQPSEINSTETGCPWCGSDTFEWDHTKHEGTEHDADCCGKPVRWDYDNNLLHAERSQADLKYLKTIEVNP